MDVSFASCVGCGQTFLSFLYLFDIEHFQIISVPEGAGWYRFEADYCLTYHMLSRPHTERMSLYFSENLNTLEICGELRITVVIS